MAAPKLPRYCWNCVHYTGFTEVAPTAGLLNTTDQDENACAAYPLGIPAGIVRGALDHSRPLPGDNGIRFEAKDAEGPKP